mgnify:CR=1
MKQEEARQAQAQESGWELEPEFSSLSLFFSSPESAWARVREVPEVPAVLESAALLSPPQH